MFLYFLNSFNILYSILQANCSIAQEELYSLVDLQVVGLDPRKLLNRLFQRKKFCLLITK
jgi:hypothetical protein